MQRRTVPDVLADENVFVDAPADWHIVLADIINSSETVAAGRHADVNMVAAGCLISVFNVTKSIGVEIPYFFGGDGGMVLVPDEILPEVLAGLHAHRQNSRENFSLELRVGSLAVSEIRKAGHKVMLAKVEESPGFNKALLTGNGFKYAEYIIKKQTVDMPRNFSIDALNLEGMECRWNKVKPPASGFEIVCFLIDAVHEKGQGQLFSTVLKKLDEIYGAIEKRHPITINMLKLKAGLKRMQREMMARYGKWKPFYLIRTWLLTLFGKLFFNYDLKVKDLRAHDYLAQLITFSEILTIDGRINTIVSGTAANRMKFVAFLQSLEQNGSIVYGHHVSTASIMTCYVEHMHDKHIHFIDGADGGYTEASKELKPKLLALRAFN